MQRNDTNSKVQSSDGRQLKGDIVINKKGMNYKELVKRESRLGSIIGNRGIRVELFIKIKFFEGLDMVATSRKGLRGKCDRKGSWGWSEALAQSC